MNFHFKDKGEKEMQITLKIEIQDEVLETLNFLASALAHANGMKNTVAALEEIKSVKVNEVKITKTEETPNTYSQEEIRAAFASKMKQGKKEELKAILNEHGVKNISGIEEEQFESIMNAIEAIS